MVSELFKKFISYLELIIMNFRSKGETEVTLESSPVLHENMNRDSPFLVNFYFSDALDLIAFTNFRVKNYINARLLSLVENPLAAYISNFLNFEALCNAFDPFEKDIFRLYIQYLDHKNNQFYRMRTTGPIISERDTRIITRIIDNIRELEINVYTNRVRQNRQESLQLQNDNELNLDDESIANLENQMES